jgi:hypothetical protein
MVWSWWGAIATTAPSASVKWLLLCVVPLLAVVMNMIAFDPAEARKAAIAQRLAAEDAPFSESWKAMFGDIGSGWRRSPKPPRASRTSGACSAPASSSCSSAPLMAELGFFGGGIVGGAKKNKSREEGQDDGRRREEAEVTRGATMSTPGEP